MFEDKNRKKRRFVGQLTRLGERWFFACFDKTSFALNTHSKKAIDHSSFTISSSDVKTVENSPAYGYIRLFDVCSNWLNYTL